MIFVEVLGYIWGSRASYLTPIVPKLWEMSEASVVNLRVLDLILRTPPYFWDRNNLHLSCDPGRILHSNPAEARANQNGLTPHLTLPFISQYS